uniref:Uncharacterized protein n=1 Tax=Panagrolaimus davidi TaxID=227884 RepID=A0A914QQN2_9BILA
MFSPFKEYSNVKGFVGFINCFNEFFKIDILDLDTEKVVKEFMYQSKDAELLINQFTTTNNTKNIFKAFIVDLFNISPNESYQTGYKLCEKLREKLNELKIPSYFISEENYLFSCLLIGSQMILKYDEIVLIILPSIAIENSISKLQYVVGEFQFTPNGYKLKSTKTLASVNPKENPNILFQQFCGSTIPKKVLVSTACCKKTVAFKKIFKPKILTLLHQGILSFTEKFILETYKWMLDKSYIKYYILPTCTRNIHAFGDYGSKENILDLFKVNINDPLPIRKTASFTKSVPEFSVSFFKPHVIRLNRKY